ncbi:MAG: DUF5721 family protein [Lachnospiraceae bacterium]
MINIHIKDKKGFTSKLFLKEDFDSFFVTEASVTTFNTYTIDGRIQKRFYTNEEYENLGKPEFSRWKDIRKLCFDMIKGSKTPIRFKIVLKLPEDLTLSILESTDTLVAAGDISGLFLNIRFENESMDCITGTSLKVFSMDKSLEEAFDRYMEKDLLALV